MLVLAFANVNISREIVGFGVIRSRWMAFGNPALARVVLSRTGQLDAPLIAVHGRLGVAAKGPRHRQQHEHAHSA